MLRSQRFLFSLWVWAILCARFTRGSGYKCPTYANIREASVGAEVFDVQELEGAWFMIATTEPTQPSFCICGINNYTIHKRVPPAIGGWYFYTNTASCLNHTVTVPIKGSLSQNASTPGLLHENLDVLNHTVGGEDPNFIFR